MIRSLLNKTIVSVFLALIGSLYVHSQTLVDIDGNEYKTSKLGMQEWISANLNVTRFRNGEVIAEAKTAEEWKAAGFSGTPAWCYFDNNPENGTKSGKLYNWFAINDPRGLAPEGWHIPGNLEWSTLVKNLLGIDYAGPKLKNTTGWKTKNGTNTIGFSALPGGSRNKDGKFIPIASKGHWWSNSEPVDVVKSTQIFSFVIYDVTESVAYLRMDKESGLSVRCIKD